MPRNDVNHFVNPDPFSKSSHSPASRGTYSSAYGAQQALYYWAAYWARARWSQPAYRPYLQAPEGLAQTYLDYYPPFGLALFPKAQSRTHVQVIELWAEVFAEPGAVR